MTQIQEKIRVIDQFLSYLVENDYPAESLATFWKKDDHIYDVAIFDIATKELIAVVELGIPNTLMATSAELGDSIKAFSKLRKQTNISLFSVSSYHSGFNVSKFISQDNTERGTFVPLKKIPNYESIKRSSLGEKRKSTLNTLDILCTISSVIVFVILLVDVITSFEFTAIQIGLLTLSIALLLIPYANKLKIFNIEFERRN